MSNKTLIAGAAIAGLLSGTTFAMSGKAPTAEAGTAILKMADKGQHVCKGHNDCKGQGGCNTMPKNTP